MRLSEPASMLTREPGRDLTLMMFLVQHVVVHVFDITSMHLTTNTMLPAVMITSILTLQLDDRQQLIAYASLIRHPSSPHYITTQRFDSPSITLYRRVAVADHYVSDHLLLVSTTP